MTTIKQTARLLVAVAGFGFAASAFAIPIQSSGTWTAIGEGDGTVAGVERVGTNDIDWGIPFGTSTAGPSGYNFTGVPESGGGEATLDGLLFPLGDFIHRNFTISLPSITGANLSLDVNFTEQGVTTNFDFQFTHIETPNNANPCAEGGVAPCPDSVNIPDVSQRVTLDGTVFAFDVVGFSQDNGVTTTTAFLTTEGQENRATLFGRLTVVDEPPVAVSEPPMLPLLGVLASGLLLAGLRRNRS